jgi:UDP-N-acetylglucosamine transferase subunit ALG13
LIFVTVGTHQQPFDRLLRALGRLDAGELVVQHGPAEPPPGVVRAEPYMPFEQVLACMREAETVITHAGVGSILCARREDHVPIVVPRRHDLGEHVDDHQAELTRALEPRGGIVAVWDTADLAAAVARSTRIADETTGDTAALCASVRAALLGDQASSSA